MIHRTLMLFGAFVLPLPAAFASTVTISAQKDNTIYFNTLPTSNGSGQGLFSGTNGAAQPTRGLIKFDVAASIPAGSTINSVQLVLSMNQTSATGTDIQLRRLLQDWGESTSVGGSGGGAGGPAAVGDATWQNAFHPTTPWSTAGGAFSNVVSSVLFVGAQPTIYTWNSTFAFVADVQSFLDSPGTNFGWMLFNASESVIPSAKRFASRESTTISDRPRLIVDFTAPGAFAPFCFGNGSGTLCPCGNFGLSGNGCPNSASLGGAQMQSSGTALLASDTFILGGLGMPNGTAIYFQGTAQQAAGAGSVFGDGLLCIGGSLVRLAVKTNVAGASAIPGAGDPSISVAGLVTAPGTRYYQIWFADTATFCSSSTFNFTNAASVTWN